MEKENIGNHFLAIKKADGFATTGFD